jgi:hypothetical protein
MTIAKWWDKIGVKCAQTFTEISKAKNSAYHMVGVFIEEKTLINLLLNWMICYLSIILVIFEDFC